MSMSQTQGARRDNDDRLKKKHTGLLNDVGRLALFGKSLWRVVLFLPSNT